MAILTYAVCLCYQLPLLYYHLCFEIDFIRRTKTNLKISYVESRKCNKTQTLYVISCQDIRWILGTLLLNGSAW